MKTFTRRGICPSCNQSIMCNGDGRIKVHEGCTNEWMPVNKRKD